MKLDDIIYIGMGFMALFWLIYIAVTLKEFSDNFTNWTKKRK